MSPAREESKGSAPSLTVHVVTLFPRLFDSWLRQGVVARAIQQGIVSLNLVDLRPHGIGRHRVTDDYPFGGGAGMVMKPDPLFAAIESIREVTHLPRILLSPSGRRFDQSVAAEYSRLPELALIAGHYEGVDDRVRQHLATDDVSIGDYVLSSGELAAMVVIDAVVRLVPGALAAASTREESFAAGLLEYPQFTRPATFREWTVPDVLLSGHHGEVERWRHVESLRRTYLTRPDLLASADLTDADRALLESWSSAQATQSVSGMDKTAG